MDDDFAPSHLLDPLPASSDLTERAVWLRSIAHKSRVRLMGEIGLTGAQRVDVEGLGHPCTLAPSEARGLIGRTRALLHRCKEALDRIR